MLGKLIAGVITGMIAGVAWQNGTRYLVLVLAFGAPGFLSMASNLGLIAGLSVFAYFVWRATRQISVGHAWGKGLISTAFATFYAGGCIAFAVTLLSGGARGQRESGFAVAIGSTVIGLVVLLIGKFILKKSRAIVSQNYSSSPALHQIGEKNNERLGKESENPSRLAATGTQANGKPQSFQEGTHPDRAEAKGSSLCAKCSQPLTINAKFCSECGTLLTGLPRTRMHYAFYVIITLLCLSAAAIMFDDVRAWTQPRIAENEPIAASDPLEGAKRIAEANARAEQLEQQLKANDKEIYRRETDEQPRKEAETLVQQTKFAEVSTHRPTVNTGENLGLLNGGNELHRIGGNNAWESEQYNFVVLFLLRANGEHFRAIADIEHQVNLVSDRLFRIAAIDNLIIATIKTNGEPGRIQSNYARSSKITTLCGVFDYESWANGEKTSKVIFGERPVDSLCSTPENIPGNDSGRSNGRPDRVPSSTNGAPSIFSGSWRIDYAEPAGELEIRVQGSQLTGTIYANVIPGGNRIEGVVSGTHIEFRRFSDAGQYWKGDVEPNGEHISGEFTWPGGSQRWTARRYRE